MAIFACSAHAQAVSGVNTYINRSLFQTAADDAGAPADNVIDFQDTPYAPATGSGFIPAFTKLGYVTFRLDGNFRHEIIEGNNVGQAGNVLYTTLAGDKTQTLTSLGFGNGVYALGFDFKNTANGPFSAGLIPQPFTFQLFSGTTSLGSFTQTVVPNGSAFAFQGFTSTMPITDLLITSLNASPNLDIVLDNFAIASQVPEPASLLLVGLGLGGLMARSVYRRRQRV